MKIATFVIFFHRLLIMTGVLLLLTALSSCTGKSNSEDDTFRQSIDDNPLRTERKHQEAVKEDSLRLGDTAKVSLDGKQK